MNIGVDNIKNSAHYPVTGSALRQYSSIWFIGSLLEVDVNKPNRVNWSKKMDPYRKRAKIGRNCGKGEKDRSNSKERCYSKREIKAELDDHYKCGNYVPESAPRGSWYDNPPKRRTITRTWLDQDPWWEGL